MSTYAEDMRTVLAEVAPHLAVLIIEPLTEWGRYAVRGPLVDDADYEVLYRARMLVRAKRGLTSAPCIDCCRASYVTQVPHPCTHMVSA